MFENAAHLAILALGELHLDPLVAAGPPLQIGVDRSIADAVDLDPVEQAFERRLADFAERTGAIGSLDAGRGQLELALQFAVGGEQQQALGVHVEPPHRDDARQALGQAIVDGRAALGITLGRQQAGRLVKPEETGRGRGLHRLPVDGHAVQRGEQRGRRLDRGAIDGDAALGDHPFDLAARGDSGAGEKLCDALRFTGGGQVSSPCGRRAGRPDIYLRPAEVRARHPSHRRLVAVLYRAFEGGTATNMLFAKRQRMIRRIIIVEDEPLVAFDNEHLLEEAGYEVVATVGDAAGAFAVIGAEPLDLVLTDIALAGDGNGIDVARAARAKGIPVLFVTGNCSEEARALAIGCLAKPYSEKTLKAALDAIERQLQGRPMKRPPAQLTLYEAAA